jgi:hypothetical protein
MNYKHPIHLITWTKSLNNLKISKCKLHSHSLGYILPPWEMEFPFRRKMVFWHHIVELILLNTWQKLLKSVYISHLSTMLLTVSITHIKMCIHIGGQHFEYFPRLYFIASLSYCQIATVPYNFWVGHVLIHFMNVSTRLWRLILNHPTYLLYECDIIYHMHLVFSMLFTLE